VRDRPAAPPFLFLRADELRSAVDMLFLAARTLARDADALLAEAGLGQAHLRALLAIAHRPGMRIGELTAALGITKQSLGRVMDDLTARGLVAARVSPDDRRARNLELTPAGRALNARLEAVLHRRVAQAFQDAGPDAVAGFWRVMNEIAAR